jgi:hypothetical protein
MTPSKKNVVRKRSGRPATGQDPVTAIRLSQQLRASVDQWADKQPDQPRRSEAVRRLIELGLSVRTTNPKHDVKQTPSARHERANVLAAEAIDRLASCPDDHEKASRKRRLIKGPKEFREVRVDDADKTLKKGQEVVTQGGFRKHPWDN